MAQQAIGILETKGLTSLIIGADAMLKAANVTLKGPMQGIGNAMVSATIVGDVAAVKAALDAGAEAARTVGDVIAAHVIARPASELDDVLPKAPAAKK